MCDGVRPCCTLKEDGKSASIDAFACELQLVMGEEGYAKLCRLAADANGHTARGGPEE